MSTGDASQLTVAPSSFSTQGTIDWTKLAEFSVTFPLAVLARCSAAGIDPYTVVVGQAIAQHLPLGPQGDQNVQQALSDLRVYSLFANALDVGFGISSFVRTLGKTDEGRSLLAVSSTLSECFSQDFSARVLHQIAIQHDVPGRLRPSVSEWLNVVKACSGSFSATKFPLLAEGLMRLDPSRQRQLGNPSPESLAKVIIAIGKIASNKLKAITIVGCSAAGWLGALAEWLWDLSITIRDSRGTSLYATGEDDSQVQIIYDERQRSTHHADLEVMSKTYFIDNCDEIFRWHHTVSLQGDGLYGGRLPWESCLMSSFGNSFEMLMKDPTTIGMGVGSAARMFEAIALGEDGITRPHQRRFFDSSYGRGFVGNALRIFPELVPIQKQAEIGVQLSLVDAKARYAESLFAIQKRCRKCTYQESCTDHPGLCPVLVFETILRICHFMAGVQVIDHLCPRRAGFEILYNQQYAVKRTKSECKGPDQWQLDPFSSVLQQYGGQPTSKDTFILSLGTYRLIDVLTLFNGRQVQTGDINYVSALSEGGLCAYLDILREFSLDPELFGLVHIMPGSIEKDGKPYRLVEDPAGGNVNISTEMLQHLVTLNRASLEVTETATSLQVSYNLQSTVPGLHESKLDPIKLDDMVTRCRGLVRCPKLGIGCEKVPAGDVVEDQTESPITKFKYGGKEIITIDASARNDYARAVMLMRYWNRGGAVRQLILDHQCWDCCLRATLKWRESIVLVV